MTEKNINFDEIVDRKNTDSLKYDFAVRRGKPEDILPLWVADMDFKTSSLILEDIQRRVEHGIFGYTETGTRYFEAVSGWLKRHHGLEIKENWLVKTPGVVFALAMAVKAYTKEKDAVLIQQPVYYPFTEVIEDNNRVVVSSNLILGEDGRYHMDFADFEKKIIEHQVKLFFLCSPHNPVGRVWTKEELGRIAEICFQYHVIIVSDEIHEDFTFDGYTHTPLLNVDERLAEITITCTSPGKTFNLAGLQISNIIIPNEKLRHAFKRQIDAAGYSQLNTIGIAACEAAYRYGEEWYRALKVYLQGNLAFVKEYLKRELPQIKLIEPEGTYLIWLDFRDLGLREPELEDFIVKKAKLWLDGGAIFGKAGEGFERINIATSRGVVKEALERIKSAVAEM
ncbi:MAG: pyridoxal phosphate-dependent aminotransferase [Lachnoclostridium sp.]|nr:pyridoxal phosphate-dependent aminotransferase [Lachnospira sp.]MCM1247429.1 pyridoxal phosphate-dependent aminotransferase [Lachnoclostridium sp.]